MILFIGEKFKDFAAQFGSFETQGNPENADKIIITTDTDDASAAVKTAKEKNIPLLAVVDGYKAVAAAFGATVNPVDTIKPGAQEWAVIDATSPVYLELESVIQVALANPYAVDEPTLPSALDCMSRDESGDIIALRNWTAPGKYGHIYAVNYDISDPKTPDGAQIMKNFFNL